MAAAPRRLGFLPRSRPPIVALPVLLAAAFGLPGVACRGASGDDAAAIRRLLKEEVEAINGRDLKALSAIWSQDPAILLFDVSPPGRFEGWDHIGRSFKDFFDHFTDIHLTIDGVRVTVEGGIGYATYDWAMTGRMGEYAVDDHGEATAIYRREPGGWRLVHAHYSSAPPGAPPAGSPASTGEGAVPGPTPARTAAPTRTPAAVRPASPAPSAAASPPPRPAAAASAPAASPSPVP